MNSAPNISSAFDASLVAVYGRHGARVKLRDDACHVATAQAGPAAETAKRHEQTARQATPLDSGAGHPAGFTEFTPTLSPAVAHTPTSAVWWSIGSKYVCLHAKGLHSGLPQPTPVRRNAHGIESVHWDKQVLRQTAIIGRTDSKTGMVDSPAANHDGPGLVCPPLVPLSIQACQIPPWPNHHSAVCRGQPAPTKKPHHLWLHNMSGMGTRNISELFI